MSTSNFLRLYREIDKSLPSSKPPDLYYQKERLEIFQSLKKNPHFNATVMNGFIADPDIVQPVKHHGKFIRIRNRDGIITEEKRRDRELAEADRKRTIEIRKVMRESTETNELINEINKRVHNKKSKTLPSRLMKKLSLVEEKRVGDNAMLRDDPYLGSCIPALNNDKDKHNATPTLVRQPITFDRGYSEMKWTLEERQKLHSLYQQFELPPPYCRNLELWKLYFLKVSDRFRVFFPQRSTEEVVLKVREMVAKRQMKELGEESFWKEVMNHLR